MESVTVILVVLTIWLLALTSALLWATIFFNRLTRGTKEGNLIKILESLLGEQGKSKKDTSKVLERVKALEGAVKLHVQKVGLVRYNPFKETGGDHSFSLALLDGNASGILITGLHTRDRTRIYIKSVLKGESTQKLSKEEQKALSVAQ